MVGDNAGILMSKAMIRSNSRNRSLPVLWPIRARRARVRSVGLAKPYECIDTREAVRGTKMRTFLVIIDESEEALAALRYAARRAVAVG
ncbi:MAG: hypothetical protein ACK4MR_12980, partial [Erythrobacter cryptus]